jgi:hypothetical protein
MSIIVTGNRVHDAALLAAEIARTTANIGVTSQTTLRANDIVYARAALASCLSNNNGSGAGVFIEMLKENFVNS